MFRKAFWRAVLVFMLLSVSACRAVGQPGEPGEASQEEVASQPTVAPTVAPAVTLTDAREGPDFDCATVGEIPEGECQALVTFFDAMQGETWNDRSGWLQSSTPCSWTGVSCIEGHVDMLALFHNGLQGQLPAALADLTQLRVLDLHNNAIQGAIPAELSQLSKLQALDLSANQVDGSVPGALGNLPALQSLVLANNELRGPLPEEIGSAAALRILDLSHNQLDGAIPATLANLTALETLRLSDNRLEGAIPHALGDLQSLAEVDLSFNLLTGTPPSALQQNAVHRLWGNALEGTIFSNGSQPQQVNFLGAAFTFDDATAASVWPELEAPGAPLDGPGMPWSSPEHIVFTLVSHTGPQEHMPLGLYLPAEAQIHIYPTAELNSEARTVVEALQGLLAERPVTADLEMVVDGPEAELPALTMLPPTNARQTLRAQVAYLSFTSGSGVRYLTQLSQGPIPINNQELFYTFQGLTDDGAHYVAAYFPVKLPTLPPSGQVSDETYASLLENWQGYLEETFRLLDGQPEAAFTPGLATLDALITSLSLESMGPIAQLQGVWPEDKEAVDDQPVLQWSAYEGATQYEVVIVDDDVYPPQAVFSESTTDLTIAVTPALDAGSYSWTMRALDRDGDVLAELNRAFFVKDTMTAMAPADGEKLDTASVLAWQAYPTATSYQIVVLDDDAYPPLVLLDETTTETTLALGLALEPGSYTWTVWAKDESGLVVAELTSQFMIETP